MLDYGSLRRSLKNLELQNNNRKNLPCDLSQLLREAVDESVIQRFEVCYDVLWKSLRRHLMESGGLPDVPASPRPVFRLAGETGVLVSAVERWMEYVNLRIGTVHDYGSEKAAALARMDGFIADAICLYQTMTGEVWEWRRKSSCHRNSCSWC